MKKPSSTSLQQLETKSRVDMVIHNRHSPIHGNRIKMLTANQLRQRQLDRQEMQSLLDKLKQLVPGIPKHRRCSKLEIIQHVIDYIFDLQTALEQHPIASSLAASALATADFVAVTTNSNIQSNSMRILSDDHSTPQSTTANVSCDRYLSMTTTVSLNPNGHGMANISPQSSHHQSYQRQQQQQQQLPQRIPGSNRQPLASIVL
ncbi:hypothetical protein BLA29_006627 [Euroglyphus maynei]|uniref:BHLH domain-containing protein n=1 Tax=Euroglyphus maynei TaxID=6958 RepID=A0A1Y3BG83_EURMA|nr:hypothetical protein BLA29_006627 [Euroglyphus maynei]